MVALIAARYTTEVDIPRAADRLYAIPPSRFVAERAALARTLAHRNDPAAGAVRKLPRPAGLAWVLNRLARERPRDMEALIAAGDQLRSGQRRALSGAGADELRRAEEDLRAQARALRSEGERIIASEGRPAPPMALARLELLLRVAASAPGPSQEALRRGVLVREPEIAPAELTGFAVLPGGGAPSRPRTASRRAPRRERELAPRVRAGEREARRSEAKQRRERERLAKAARRAAAAAGARADREERAAEQAAARAQRARERASAARAEADRLAASLLQLERSP